MQVLSSSSKSTLLHISATVDNSDFHDSICNCVLNSEKSRKSTHASFKFVFFFLHLFSFNRPSTNIPTVFLQGAMKADNR